ncbi:MAG: glycosyl hydrolase, partial [Actinobacteria bacterium]|nr:glycosyl hydrolase [Actinomycetota bacterium]
MCFKLISVFMGDINPFYWEGEYHAFYIGVEKGRPFWWRHAVSRDLISWDELPAALDVGEPGDPDSDGIWSGSILEKDGVFHIFYCGHTLKNSKYPPETMCHATSSDLISWQKDRSNPILLPDNVHYKKDGNFRDPLVIWNDDENCYFMFIAAHVKDAPTPRRGCVGVAKSRDLVSWEL